MADLHAVFIRFIEDAIGKHPVVAEIRKRLDDIEQDPELQDISDRVEELEVGANVGPQLKQSIASHLHDLLSEMLASAAGTEATEERVDEIEEIVEEVEEEAVEEVEQAEEEVENPPEYVSGDQPIPPPLNPEPTPPEDLETEVEDIPEADDFGPSEDTDEETEPVVDWSQA